MLPGNTTRKVKPPPSCPYEIWVDQWTNFLALALCVNDQLAGRLTQCLVIVPLDGQGDTLQI